LRKDTKLIVLMAVNNETGVKSDIEAIAAIAEESNVPFVVDGVALLGKEPFTIPSGVSAVAFSGHKLHAPKGSGMVFIRKRVKCTPLLFGGAQEFQRRAGTENLAAILGLAEAIRLLEVELPSATKRMQALRDRLEEGIISSISDVTINGEAPRVVNTSNLSFEGVDGESLLMSLDLNGVAVSHGSACSSGSLEPSRILLNMGIPRARARSSIRFSLSRFTTRDEIERCIEIVIDVVGRLRSLRTCSKSMIRF
jgi:cysteine desulfurase